MQTHGNLNIELEFKLLKQDIKGSYVDGCQVWEKKKGVSPSHDYKIQRTFTRKGLSRRRETKDSRYN